MAGEPWCLTQAEIAALDDEAMAALYLDRPETDAPPAPGAAADPLDRPFQCDYQRLIWQHKYAAGRQLGYADAQIERDCEAAWAAKVADPRFRRRHGVPDPK